MTTSRILPIGAGDVDDALRIGDLSLENVSSRPTSTASTTTGALDPLTNGATTPCSSIASTSSLSDSDKATLSTTTAQASSSSSQAYNYTISLPTYPAVTPHLHSAPISILSTPESGRGLFASRPIPAGTLLEIAPVLVLSNEEYYGAGGQEGDLKGVEGSKLRGYVFTWKGKEKGMALALGLGSLFNHSNRPNVSFEIHATEYTIHYKTSRTVQEGEELCIFYGHDAHFGGEVNGRSGEVSSDEEGPWGGLGELQVEAQPKKRRQPKPLNAQQWDEDIVLFEDLDWIKVTNLVDPEKQPLTTIDCYVTDVPARHVPLAFSFIKLHSPTKHPNGDLGHLKRVRPVSYTSKSSDAPVSVLLYPCSNSPPNLLQLLADHPAFVDLDLKLELYTLPVPATIARTDAQADEWGKLWPVQMMHIREGPKARPRAQGWERCKMEWIRREAETCWTNAHAARERGEHPIACHVTDSFHPDSHSPDSLPLTLSSAIDTRSSTSNPLLHAVPNLIDSVALLDRANQRPPPLLPTHPPPYLLTGMSLFISHEPCLMCSMALLHSRISSVFYLKKAPGSGGCGSVFAVQEGEGLNHRFEVWEWNGGEALGTGLDVELDP